MMMDSNTVQRALTLIFRCMFKKPTKIDWLCRPLQTTTDVMWFREGDDVYVSILIPPEFGNSGEPLTHAAPVWYCTNKN